MILKIKDPDLFDSFTRLRTCSFALLALANKIHASDEALILHSFELFKIKELFIVYSMYCNTKHYYSAANFHSFVFLYLKFLLSCTSNISLFLSASVIERQTSESLKVLFFGNCERLQLFIHPFGSHRESLSRLIYCNNGAESVVGVGVLTSSSACFKKAKLAQKGWILKEGGTIYKT